MVTTLAPSDNDKITIPLVSEKIINSSFCSAERQELNKLTGEILEDLKTTRRWSDLLQKPEEIEYNPIPPQQTFEVTAKYQFERKGQPLDISEFNSDVSEELEEADYNSMPPKRSFKVTVNYQFKGKGKPLPYPTDS